MVSFTSDLESQNVELQTMPGLINKAARLPQDRAEVQKDIVKRGARLVMLKEVRDEITVKKKEVAESVTSMTNAREHRLITDARTRRRGVPIKLFKKQEQTLGRDFASVEKEFFGFE